MNRGSFVIAVLQAMVLALALATPAHAQDKGAGKDLALRGDAKCTKCHNQEDTSPVLAIGQTRHGTKADGRTPTCSSCHGESDAHLNKPAGAKPDRTFGKKSTLTAEAKNQVCLTCHQGGKRIHWSQSLHANRDVACSTCHEVHTPHDMVRDKVAQSETCFTCHKQQRTEIHRQSRHPIIEGKVSCSDCHNPHGTAGEKQLVRDNVNDTCYSCHMEKRGPFVRTHQPVQENCAICHNPHGSINDNLLRARSPFLCQSCHEPTSHRGNVGSFTGSAGGSTAANLLARGCLNCHTNIHGTNNPRDVSNERTFRR